jgi:hypothetical protein
VAGARSAHATHFRHGNISWDVVRTDVGSFRQPGPTLAPNAASINPTTGVYSWNTTGATLGPVALNTLYSTQVTIEERDCLDNCPIDFNPDQSDIDGDGLGDVCDPEDVPMNVTRLRMKGDTSTHGDNGSVLAKGHFVSLLPADLFTHVQGVTFRVRDRFESDVTHFWTPSECAITSGTGRVRCQSADKRFAADFRPVPATPTAVRWSFKMKKQPVLAPFKGPIAVTLSYGAGIDRVGRIQDCASKNVSIVCEEL